MNSRPSSVDKDDWATFQSGLEDVRRQFQGVEHAGGGREMSLADLEAMNNDPSRMGNDAAVEIQWAMKAGKHAETYFNILQKCKQKNTLRLTRYDDEIYEKFRDFFPNLEIGQLSMVALKEEKAKNLWRIYIELFKEKLAEFDLGTLIRMDSSKDYSPENAEVVPRMQFLAIEIARNREGLNNSI